MLRLTPFDTSTEEGRSKERYRRAALTTLSSFAARGVSIVTALVSVPLTVNYLGPERYGMWMTISSLIAVLGFMDLGMGNGLMNALSEAHGRSDHPAAVTYVSSALAMLTGIAIVFGILFYLAYPLVPWEAVFKVSSKSAVAEAGPATAVFAGCFLLAIPAGLVQRVQMGHQQGLESNIWIALGALFGLAGVILAIRVEAGLPWLVLAMSGGPILASVLNGLVLFGLKERWLCPRRTAISRDAAHRVARTGVLFLTLQIAVAVAYSADNIVVAQLLGPEAVTNYSIPSRVFGLLSTLLYLSMNPLWPAYSEAISRGDIRWVKDTLIRSVGLALLVATPAAAALTVLGPQLIEVWVGPSVSVSFLLLAGFGTWTVIGATGNAVAMFLNGAGEVRFQVIMALLMASASILMKVVLAQAIGLPGVVWGTVIAYLVFTAIPCALYVPRYLAGLSQRLVPDSR